MDKNKAVVKLKQARVAIDAALEALEDEVNTSAAVRFDECWWCGKPVFRHERHTRRAHGRCFLKWYRQFVGPGKKYSSTDMAEEEGALPPKSRRGKKPSIDMERNAEIARLRIREQNS